MIPVFLLNIIMQSFSEFFESKLKKSSISNDEPYEVYDKHTGDIIWRGTYGKKHIATRIIDKKNNEYGGYRYFGRLVKKPLLEYRHKDAFGGIKQSIHPDNKKGSNLTIDPLSRKIPWVKGPYKKERKHGETLIGDELTRELGSLNGVEFEDGKEIKRKNSNQILKLFTNAHGQPCGRIIEIKQEVNN